MKRTAAYGVSRTRDARGVIVKRDVRPWSNCVHTMCGGGWETMEVLVLEVYDDEASAARKLQEAGYADTEHRTRIQTDQHVGAGPDTDDQRL